RVHDDRTLEDQLAACLVVKRNRPAAELVEALDGVDEVAEERVAPQLAVGDDVEPARLLQLDGLVDRPVLDALELGRARAAGLPRLARLDQIGRAQQAADRVGANHRSPSASKSTTSRAIVRSSPDSRAYIL